MKLKEFDEVFQKFNEASVLTHKALILPAYNFSLLICTQSGETQQIIMWFYAATMGANMVISEFCIS